MKKLSIFLATVFFSVHVFAQAPERISYQAVIRDAGDDLVSDQSVSTQISILKGSASGTAVYVETHTAMTNANGLLSLQIGSGSPLSGSFSAIDWSSGSYYLKMETDPTGGSNYTITSLSQMLSVPYSLHAKSADKITGYGTAPGQMLYWDGNDWKEIEVPAASQEAVLTLIDGVPTWKGGTYPPGVPMPITSPTGKVWLDRNLGAVQVASYRSDSLSYGYLYQWGRGSDGHQNRVSPTTAVLSPTDTPGHSDFISGSSDWRSAKNDNLWQGVNGVNNPCPIGFRIPSSAEFLAERTYWASSNAQGAFESVLRLPSAGYRQYTSGELVSTGENGYYWTSNRTGDKAHYFRVIPGEATDQNNSRAFGFSVRCIQN